MKTRTILTAALLLAIAAPPVLAADKGTVKVVTEPGDAKVYVDGKRKGSTPSEKGQTFAMKLVEGEYVIEAVKPTGGPQEWHGSKEVFVGGDTLQTVTLKLTQRMSAAFVKQMRAKYPNGAAEPDMVSIPAGRFRMGCVSGAGENCNSYEKPAHQVSVPAFEMGRTEVTFEQWDVCVAFGGCEHLPDDEGWGRGDRPVINVSWDDIQGYIRWLNRQTGKHYRLPSEAEWEYAARAGRTSQYSWGDQKPVCRTNLVNGARFRGCKEKRTAPVASYPVNRFGLYDMHGNVGEWVQDCWNKNYQGAPSDGSAWLSGECGRRVLRGGSLGGLAGRLRSAYRNYLDRDYRILRFGFRLARTR